MEHISLVRPIGKFPEKVENLKRWARFPGWNFRTEFRVPNLHNSQSLYQFQVHGRALRLTGVYNQMEQLFTDQKFHLCSHRNFRFFFLNGKCPTFEHMLPSLTRKLKQSWKWQRELRWWVEYFSRGKEANIAIFLQMTIIRKIRNKVWSKLVDYSLKQDDHKQRTNHKSQTKIFWTLSSKLVS